nr:iron chelate uptake ABC transporter family permease subunit [Alysiella crassa]
MEEGWYFSGSLNLWEMRYPRILAAAACGVLSALAGVLLQRLTGNAMASPELLGIGSGTAVAVMAAVWWLDVAAGGWGFWLSGVVGALATLLAIVLFNRKNGMQPEKILLTGMALAALSTALVQIWSASGDYRIVQMQTWLSGSTYAVSGGVAVGLTALAMVSWAVCLPMQRWLGLLGLNATVAAANGVNVAWARGVLILLAAIMTAAATLTVGIFEFCWFACAAFSVDVGGEIAASAIGVCGDVGGGVDGGGGFCGAAIIVSL